MTLPRQSVARDSEEERVLLALAANKILAAQILLAEASARLEKTQRTVWWYSVNRLYHGALAMAKILDAATKQ